jgi:hypothetical protein
MNFFSFGSTDGSGFKISPQFWIFVIVSIPLTALTLGAWIVIVRRQNAQRALGILPCLKGTNESAVNAKLISLFWEKV